MESTWESRDLPVLVTVAERLDPKPGELLSSFEVALALMWPHETVMPAIVALLSGGYIEGTPQYDFDGGGEVIVRGVTERGRRTVGLWPSGDQLQALVAALQAVAEDANDADERSKLQRLAGQVMGLSKSVGTSVATAYALRLAGLG